MTQQHMALRSVHARLRTRGDAKVTPRSADQPAGDPNEAPTCGIFTRRI